LVTAPLGTITRLLSSNVITNISGQGTIGVELTYGIGYDSYARHAEQVGAVTAEEVRDIARELIRPERVVRSIVGPGAEELDAAS
ncbi:MAG: hypothetical protein AAFU79_24180, partial [Myxococcota bacterium]